LTFKCWSYRDRLLWVAISNGQPRSAPGFGLRGDFDAAADPLEAAIKAGWSRYTWAMNDPTWGESIADPRIARMLDDVKGEHERQRAVVQQADAEHDFRAEFAAKRSAPED
jgi:hypothetical protein